MYHGKVTFIAWLSLVVPSARKVVLWSPIRPCHATPCITLPSGLVLLNSQTSLTATLWRLSFMHCPVEVLVYQLVLLYKGLHHPGGISRGVGSMVN
jgi:hypothetical protein